MKTRTIRYVKEYMNDDGIQHKQVEKTVCVEPSPDMKLVYAENGKPFFVKEQGGRLQFVMDADPEVYPYKK